MIRQFSGSIEIATSRQGLIDVTHRISAWLRDYPITDGVLTIFCRHTSASLLIQENAAREVRTDLEAYFARIAPEDPAAYAHDDEGADDMPAHLRAALIPGTAVDPSVRGQAGARRLAAHISVRAPPTAASPHARAASDRRMTR